MDKYKLEIELSDGKLFNVYTRKDCDVMIYLESSNEMIQDETKLLKYLDGHFHREKVNEYNKVNSKGCNC